MYYKNICRRVCWKHNNLIWHLSSSIYRIVVVVVDMLTSETSKIQWSAFNGGGGGVWHKLFGRRNKPRSNKRPTYFNCFLGELKKRRLCVCTNKKSFWISHFSKLFTTNIFQLFLVVKLALVFTNVDAKYFYYNPQVSILSPMNKQMFISITRYPDLKSNIFLLTWRMSFVYLIVLVK